MTIFIILLLSVGLVSAIAYTVHGVALGCGESRETADLVAISIAAIGCIAIAVVLFRKLPLLT